MWYNVTKFNVFFATGTTSKKTMITFWGRYSHLLEQMTRNVNSVTKSWMGIGCVSNVLKMDCVGLWAASNKIGPAVFWNVGYVFNAENPLQLKLLTRKIRNYEAEAWFFENKGSCKIVNLIAKNIKLSFLSNKDMAQFLHVISWYDQQTQHFWFNNHFCLELHPWFKKQMTWMEVGTLSQVNFSPLTTRSLVPLFE